MTVLSIIQGVCPLVSLTVPQAAMTSTDQNIVTLVALLREELEELHTIDRQEIMREHTFVTVASATQASAAPADLERFVTGTFWNRTQSQPVYGPLSPQEWQRYQVWPNGSGITYLQWRKRDGAFLMTPTPAAGDTIAYEYITSTKAVSSALADQTDIAADDDTILMPEALVKIGLRWRWKAAKGLDYAEDMATYERRKSQNVAVSSGAMPRLSISGGYGDRWATNTLEGNWPDGS